MNWRMSSVRCSDCNRPIRPVVAVDIDGTLAQYHRHFLEFASSYYDRPFDMGYTGEMELHDWMGINLTEYRQCKLAYRQGGGKRMIPIYPGAEHFMHWLRREEVEIWITTTRPYLRLDGTDPDTRFWLDKHKISYDYLLYHDDKYRVLGETVPPARVIAIVDDLESQLVAAMRQGYPDWVPVQPMRAHNRFENQVKTRFSHFYELETIIKERVHEFYSAHP